MVGASLPRNVRHRGRGGYGSVITVSLRWRLFDGLHHVQPARQHRAMQQRLDDRGMSFGLTRVAGEDAMLCQIRMRTSDASASNANTDPMAAAMAVAAPGCRVGSIDAQVDCVSFKVAYEC